MSWVVNGIYPKGEWRFAVLLFGDIVSPLTKKYCSSSSATSSSPSPSPSPPKAQDRSCSYHHTKRNKTSNTTMTWSLPKTLLLLSCLSPVVQGQRRNAVAFECNGSNQKIIRNTPIRERDEIKICVTPTSETIDDNVYLFQISNFEFIKPSRDGVALNSITQTAIKDSLVADNGRTRISCFSGATACSLTTKLQGEFFDSDGTVRGKGEVALQFGRDSIRRDLQDDREFLVTFDLDLTSSGGEDEDATAVTKPHQLRGGATTRSLQTGEFAGWSDVEYKFEVEDGITRTDTGEVIDDERDSFPEHWHNLPNEIQALYVFGLLVLLTILCCLCGACLLWKRCCADAPALIRHSISRVTRGTVYEEDYDYPRTNNDSKYPRHEDEWDSKYPRHPRTNNDSEEEWDSNYPRHVDPEEDGSRSEEHSELSEIDEDMMLTNEPHNDDFPEKVGDSHLLMNAPHNRNNEAPEEIDGKLLLTAAPHQNPGVSAANNKKKRASTTSGNAASRPITGGGEGTANKKKAAHPNKRKSARKLDA